ncbi:hypothetical protein CIW48_26220 [Methylobacterium sp. P1-11]|uniref:hypothetical protein n=1 Tax=Methylobacterium sp. P1-11 TaxID=2024616 RepID=UPI0011EBE71F|nr:hypothetical protein [Methylobacterium sp. P1-11]KAA0121005.1 hypothetical protein CIW48_26220 [Methylobacterium sp. P1-11]
MSRRKRAAASVIPAGFAAPEIEASRLLREIGTPEAMAAIAELIEAGERRCAAFSRAAKILLAATPTPPTEH